MASLKRQQNLDDLGTSHGIQIDNLFKTELMQVIQLLIQNAQNSSEPPWSKISKRTDRGDVKGLWGRFNSLYKQYLQDSSIVDLEEVHTSLNEFYSAIYKPELEVLRHSKDDTLVEKKFRLLAELRKLGVFCLERGEIETYYPETVTGNDKIKRAQEYCRCVQSRSDVLAHCNEIDGRSELEIIFDSIFNS